MGSIPFNQLSADSTYLHAAKRAEHCAVYLQSYRSNAEDDKALKERLREAGASGFLAHDDRSQLTVITDKYQLTTAQHHRTHALRLRSLRALINQHRTKLPTHAHNLVLFK